MRITIANGRSLAASLTSATDAAEAAGATDFELLDTLAAVDDDAREQLVAAIRQADGTSAAS